MGYWVCQESGQLICCCVELGVVCPARTKILECHEEWCPVVITLEMKKDIKGPTVCQEPSCHMLSHLTHHDS